MSGTQHMHALVRLSARIQAILAAVFLTGAVGACAIELEDMVTKADEGVPMSFSLSLASGGEVATKMSDAIVQSSGVSSFRGIDYVYAIPFASHAAQNVESTASPVSASDSRWFENLTLRQRGIPNSFSNNADGGSHPGLVNNNNSHLYGLVYVKLQTGSILVYGKATDTGLTTTVDGKHVNGVLEPTKITVAGDDYSSLEVAEYPGQIGFDLEPIATGEAFTNAISGLLDYLSGIANTVLYATYTNNNNVVFPLYSTNNASDANRLVYTWSIPSGYGNHTTLRNQYQSLTNGTVSIGNIGSLLSTIYSQLSSIGTSYSYRTTAYYQGGNNGNWTTGDYYYAYQLAQAVMANINNSQYVTVSGNTVTLKSEYLNIADGLPAGAARIQWNSTSNRFEMSSGSGTVTINNVAVPIAPVTSFCYPPSLWYYTNSNIRVSDDESITEEYKSSNNTWTTILNKYSYGTVASRTVSAAVVKPLNYGVGCLVLNINTVSSSSIRDKNNTSISVNNTNFPLTGIIIGGQKNVSYDFTPRTGMTYYVFDNKVNTGYISSNTSSTATRTLVVQSEDGEDIRFALEFQNNRGSAFQGLDGQVPAGGKFYLIGSLEYPANSSVSSSVFHQDMTTSVTVTISSLANALNTIPDFRSEMLEIGVQTQMKWILATPSENPMY